MNLPFTIDQFLEVMKNYNLSVWPFQIVLNMLAVIAIVLCFKTIKASSKTVNGILAFYWLWIGIAYHLVHFTSINKAAYLFGILNIAQGLLFMYTGLLRNKLQYKFRPDFYGISGVIFILYALVIYPILSHAFGHVYPEQPTFGLPCPTTIFTFGILLWTTVTVPKYVLIIPFLWSLIGFSAAVNLRITEDFGLLAAGIIGTVLIAVRDRNRKKAISQ
jgi:hypothetical protein